MPRGGPVYRDNVIAVPSLTASAQVYSPGQAARKLRKVGKGSKTRLWQRELWDCYDIVSEYRFGVDWVGNLLSKAIIEVWYNGKPTTNQVALDALASLFGGPEGQAEMLRLLGINFTVAGDAWVIGIPGQETESGEDEWKVIASVKVSGQGDKMSVGGDPLSDHSLPIRVWKAHPVDGDEPNSPSRALLPILSELIMLTKVVAAQGDSRLISAGILWVPVEIELPAMPNTVMLDDGTEETSQQLADGAEGLYNRLIRLGSIALENRETAAAQIPLVVAAPGEFLEKIQKTDFWSGFDEHCKTLRDEAIRRIAIGMDMPPEVITGTADVNHWGAWAIEEAAIKSHTEPLLDLIIASLTSGYLRPFLKSEKVPDWQGYSFKANTAALRMRPNRSKEAVELYDRGALNRRTLLIENGFDPDSDMMEGQEWMLWMLQKLADGSSTPEQVAAAYKLLGINGIPGETLPEVREARPTRSITEHPTRTEPDPEESEAIGAVTASAGFVVDGVLLASEAWVRQALRRAGNRLKNKVGTKIGTRAPDIYLSVDITASEALALIEDAWDDLDDMAYPGIDCDRLKGCLNDYTLMLLRMQKPYSRQSLARHLTMELSEDAA